MLNWMNPKALQIRQKYVLMHTTNTVRALPTEIKYKVDVNTLEKSNHTSQLTLNEIGHVALKLSGTLNFDPYKRNRQTGSIILVDEATNETVGAGMIL
jgi:sulfate adenylyltransferase subunit 1